HGAPLGRGGCGGSTERCLLPIARFVHGAARDRLAVDAQPADAGLARAVDRQHGPGAALRDGVAQALLELRRGAFGHVESLWFAQLASVPRPLAAFPPRRGARAFGPGHRAGLGASQAKTALAARVVARLALGQRVDPELELQVVPAQQITRVVARDLEHEI